MLLLRYGNSGLNDAAAPIIELSLPAGFAADTSPNGYRRTGRLQVGGLLPGFAQPVLPPGASREIPIFFTASDSLATYSFSAEQFGSSDPIRRAQVIDWASIEAASRPPDVDPVLWQDHWTRMTNQAGGTYGQLYDGFLAHAQATLNQSDLDVTLQSWLMSIGVAPGLTKNGGGGSSDPCPSAPNFCRIDSPGSIAQVQDGNGANWEVRLKPISYLSPSESTVPAALAAYGTGHHFGGNPMPGSRNYSIDQYYLQADNTGVSVALALRCDLPSTDWIQAVDDRLPELGCPAPDTNPSIDLDPTRGQTCGGTPVYGGGPLASFGDEPSRSFGTLSALNLDEDATYHCFAVAFDPGDPSGLTLLPASQGLQWGFSARKLCEPDQQPDAPPGGGDSRSVATTTVVRPLDPNDKVGPTGFGENKVVSADLPMAYTIDFENVSTATAPAHTIRITDPIAPNLDPRTFRLGEIVFGTNIILVPQNRSFFQTKLTLNSTGGKIEADISAGVNITTGEMFWLLTAIDPNTGEPPEDPLLGLLPPNDNNHIGEGHVTYTIRPRSDIATGATIANTATIIFDNNEPINTPSVFNTIDAGAPNSQLTVSTTFTSDTTFTVSWSGRDDTGGSGVASYDIVVSDNGASPTAWLRGTTLTSAPFVGRPGHTYAFSIAATDNVGNREPDHSAPDATTTIDRTVIPLAISHQPANRTDVAGGTAFFTVDATGTEPLSYQWRHDGADLLHETGSVLHLSNLVIEQAGAYDVVVTDFFGSTLISSAAQLIVRLVPMSLGAKQDTLASVSAAKLLAINKLHATYPLTLTAVSGPSTHGGLVTSIGVLITYTPPSGYVGPDLFTYTVSDGHGSSASGDVLVTVTSSNSQPGNNMISPPARTGDAFSFRYVGIPGRTYVLQSATAATGPWSDVPGQSVVADSTGLIQFTVPIELGSPMGFYRIRGVPRP